jgi:hypothetical protein
VSSFPLARRHSEGLKSQPPASARRCCTQCPRPTTVSAATSASSSCEPSALTGSRRTSTSSRSTGTPSSRLGTPFPTSVRSVRAIGGRLAFATPQLEPAARALPGAVTPFHLGSATKADLPHGGKSRKASGYTRAKPGGVAQRLERRTHNPQVGGSNPPAAIRPSEPTPKRKRFRRKT